MTRWRVNQSAVINSNGVYHWLLAVVLLAIECLLFLVAIVVKYYLKSGLYYHISAYYHINIEMNKGRIKEIGIKARTYYFFDDMIYIKSLDLNKIKIEETERQTIASYYQ